MLLLYHFVEIMRSSYGEDLLFLQETIQFLKQFFGWPVKISLLML